jgi:LysM repeat protein
MRRPVLVPALVTCAVFGVAACSSGDGGDADRDSPSRSGATTTTAAATTTTKPGPVSYTVKRGDTLTSIARFFHVATEAIILTNGLASADTIAEGQVLQIPPAPPVQLAVNPPKGAVGTVFEFTLVNAIAGEIVTFMVAGPDGSVFTGSPHSASAEGLVTATYRSAGDVPGTYVVTATGERGTNIQTGFDVEAG